MIYTPEAVRRSFVTHPSPKAPERVERPEPPERVFVRPPLDLRIWDAFGWCVKYLTIRYAVNWISYTIRRGLVWALNVYPLARSFIEAMASAKVSQPEYVARCDACDSCEAKVEKRGHSFCGACHCPKWRIARLERKNWLSGWKCPLHKHAGEYYRFRSSNIPKSGCAGCGHKMKG